jgi:hypothetical protein
LRFKKKQRDGRANDLLERGVCEGAATHSCTSTGDLGFDLEGDACSVRALV